MNKTKTRVISIVALMTMLLAAFCIAGANADVVVYSPDKMLRQADVVAEGTISSVSVKGSRTTAVLNIEKVLKGKVAGKLVRITATSDIAKGTAPNAFPPKGTRVFTAISRDGKAYGLTAGRNAVAVIVKGHVTKLYGESAVIINKRIWKPADYVKYYDSYYHRGSTVQAEPVKPEGDGVIKSFTENENGQKITLKPGEKIRVLLTSNPSTGFKWSYWKDPDLNIVSISEAFFNPNSSDGPSSIVGAAGKQCWTIKALKEGRTVFDVAYNRPWESVQPAQTYKLDIEVAQ